MNIRGGGHAGAFVSPTFLIGADITPENCSVLGPFQKYFPRGQKGGDDIKLIY